jgi:hypothetical protein
MGGGRKHLHRGSRRWQKLILARAGRELPEVLERHAAGRRDAIAIGHQTTRDLFTIGNVSAAHRHGVAHARIVIIVLRVRGNTRELRHKAEEGKNCGAAKVHGPFPISGK